jgi:hypothetical protein
MKNKEKIRYFILGLLLMTLLFSGCAPGFLVCEDNRKNRRVEEVVFKLNDHSRIVLLDASKTEELAFEYLINGDAERHEIDADIQEYLLDHDFEIRFDDKVIRIHRVGTIFKSRARLKGLSQVTLEMVSQLLKSDSIHDEGTVVVCFAAKKGWLADQSLSKRMKKWNKPEVCSISSWYMIN